jgi:hypothetical protein
MNKETGGPAFPIKGPVMTSDEQGMTLRDYFAAKAMQGLFSCGKAHDEHTAHVTAKASYLMADAMLKAREA